MHISLITLLALLTHATSSRCLRNPGSYEFSTGAIRGVIVHNGPSVTNIQPFSAPDEKVFKAYSKNFRSTKPFYFGQNVVVLDMPGGKRVMIDTGAKPDPLFPFWANTGLMLQNLIAAGIGPKSIDHVIITHGHADHVNGLIDDEGAAVFPNAHVYIGRTEHKFWNARKPDPSAQISASTFGLKYIPSPGHSPGHNAVQAKVGKDVLIIAGDTWVSKPDQVQHPIWKFFLDSKPRQAIKSRKTLLAMMAAKRYLVVAFHETFPGLGYVTRNRASYDWIPAPMERLGLPARTPC